MFAKQLANQLIKWRLEEDPLLFLGEHGANSLFQGLVYNFKKIGCLSFHFRCLPSGKLTWLPGKSPFYVGNTPFKCSVSWLHIPSLKLTETSMKIGRNPKGNDGIPNHPFPSPLSYLIPESTCNANNRLSHWKKKHLPTGPLTVRAGWISPSFLGGFKTPALEKHREPKQQCALSVLSRYLQGLYLPGGCLGFLPSTVVFVGVEILQCNWWVFVGWG